MPNLDQPPFAASLVAKWFIRHAQTLSGQDLDNLKLQKLLFLAHARTLSELHQPLLRERVEAWKYGPVVQTVYREFSEFDDKPIELELAADGPWEHLPDVVVGMLDATWDHFGAYSGWRLRELTHEVGPWRRHYSHGIKNIQIPNDEIRDAWVEFRIYGATSLPVSAAEQMSILRARLTEAAREQPLGTREGDPADLTRQLDATAEHRDEAARLLR